MYAISKSMDGGQSWNAVNTTVPAVQSLVFSPSHAMFAGTSAGVFKSTDAGVNFAPAGSANTIVSLLAIDPVHPGVLYAATFSGLYKSVDSGASWSPINQGLDQIAAHASVNVLLVDPARADVLYLAASGYGVFRSTEGGANWAAFNDGLTFLDVRSLALSQRDPAAPRGRRSGVRGPNTLYAGTLGGVFKIQ